MDPKLVPRNVRLVGKFFLFLSILCFVLMAGSSVPLWMTISLQKPFNFESMLAFGVLTALFLFLRQKVLKLIFFAYVAALAICFLSAIIIMGNLFIFGGSTPLQLSLTISFLTAALLLFLDRRAFVRPTHN